MVDAVPDAKKRSPASAGIDPVSRSPFVISIPFPRKRGDRPETVRAGSEVRDVPPQARG